MPCRTDDDGAYERRRASEAAEAREHAEHMADKYKAEADLVTRLLCSVMQILEKEEIAGDALTNVEGLAEWWAAHQEVDRKRVAKEVSSFKGFGNLSLEQLREIEKIIYKRPEG